MRINVLVSLLLISTLPPVLRGQPTAADEHSTEQVVARMMDVDKLLSPQLREYTSVRRYVLENKRFGKRAEMTVRLTFRYPGRKDFEVVSEQGSATIRKRVFRKMIESELEASQDDMRDTTRITPRNYSFRLTGSEALDGRKSFVLEAMPKTKSKYLFQGKIWVDAETYGIARIEGAPAQNPSFWIRKTAFAHQYKRFGPFWLAVLNTSSTDVLVFGKTDVRIEYFDYHVNEQPGQKPSGM